MRTRRPKGIEDLGEERERERERETEYRQTDRQDRHSKPIYLPDNFWIWNTLSWRFFPHDNNHKMINPK